MSIVMKLIGMINGWKSVIGYILLNVPFISTNPMLLGAAKEVANDVMSEVAWANLLAQFVLAAGLIHKVIKNFK